MPSIDGRKLCRICVSPYRSEIETLLRSTVNMGEIVKKYADLMKISSDSLRFSLKNHINKRHAPARAVLIPEFGQRVTTLEGFAQKLLDIGNTMVDADPSKVKIADVISAQKAVTERQKLKLGESELMIKVARMFGGLPEPIQGEEVEDGKLLGAD